MSTKRILIPVLVLLVAVIASHFVLAQEDLPINITDPGFVIDPLDSLALIGTILLVFLVIVIGVYVYTSFAYMYIGRRASITTPGLAWIPGIGPQLVAQRAAKMPWWPFLLLLVPVLAVIFFIGSLGSVVNTGEEITGSSIAVYVPLILIAIAAFIVFIVFSYIWHWKMFEAVGRPGWWILLSLIPYIGGIILLILLGIAAWGTSAGTQNRAMVKEVPVAEKTN